MTLRKVYNMIPDTTLICSIVLAYLVDSHFPIIKIIRFPINLIGWLLIMVGISLALYILTMLRSKHTSTDAIITPSTFITNGPYSFSRNPFYLSYLVITIGTAFVLGSLTAFIAPIMCFISLHLTIIPLEEKNLQMKFGEEYNQYKYLVRRWI